MIIARLLADEGAELRHSEIMSLFVQRQSERPYQAVLANLLNLSDLRSSLGTIRKLENLRKKYATDADKDGLRVVREQALKAKKQVNEIAANPRTDGTTRQINIEISQWFSVWLQTPVIFEDWVEMRQRSADFVEKFGHVRPD
jgi:DNA-binding transcriptional regulator YbjK